MKKRYLLACLAVWGCSLPVAYADSAVESPAVAPSSGQAASTALEDDSENLPEPSVEELQEAVSQYVGNIVETKGRFKLDDQETRDLLELSLEGFLDPIVKEGEYLYVVCAQMRNVKTNDLLDVDFELDMLDVGDFDVLNMRVHKINGQSRYEYDSLGNRVVVAPGPEESTR